MGVYDTYLILSCGGGGASESLGKQGDGKNADYAELDVVTGVDHVD